MEIGGGLVEGEIHVVLERLLDDARLPRLLAVAQRLEAVGEGELLVCLDKPEAQHIGGHVEILLRHVVSPGFEHEAQRKEPLLAGEGGLHPQVALEARHHKVSNVLSLQELLAAALVELAGPSLPCEEDVVFDCPLASLNDPPEPLGLRVLVGLQIPPDEHAPPELLVVALGHDEEEALDRIFSHLSPVPAPTELLDKRLEGRLLDPCPTVPRDKVLVLRGRFSRPQSVPVPLLKRLALGVSTLALQDLCQLPQGVVALPVEFCEESDLLECDQPPVEDEDL